MLTGTAMGRWKGDPLADARSGADDTRQKGGSARAWTAMLLGVTAVFAAGVLLFAWHSAMRRALLEGHYDRVVARTADQIKLRWEETAKRVSAGMVSPADPAGLESAPERACPHSAPDTGAFFNADHTALVRKNPSGEPRCWQMSLSTLLTGAPTVRATRARTRRFAQLFLTDAEGTVFAAERRTTPELMTGKLPLEGKDILRAAPKRERIQLGASTYFAFFRPVLIPTGDREGAPPLFVCGLVPERELTADSRRVESTYALFGLFVLAMAIVCLPAAKLWLIGPEVRYRRLDVLVFKGAVIAGGVLSTLLVLALVARHGLQQQTLDPDLRDVAHRLAHRLRSEIDDATAMLGAIQAAGGLGPVEGDTCLVEPASRLPSAPRWTVAFALDRDGKQVGKIYHREASRVAPTDSRCLDVADRRYFRELMEGRVRALSPERAGMRAPMGTAEVVRSRVTGELGLVVAVRAPRGRAEVLAVELPLGPLLKQLLPLDVQTIVVNPAGRVMLHSDNASFHQQSLFADVGESDVRPLREALESELTGPLDTEYLGAPSRAYVVPLPAGWSAIAIAPLERIDLPTRHMVLWTLLLGVMGLLACAGIYMVACLLRPVSLRDGEPVGLSLRAAALVRDTAIGMLILLTSAAASSLKGLVPALLGRRRAGRSGRAGPKRTRIAPWALVLMAVAASVASAFAYAYGRVVDQHTKASLHHAAVLRLRHPECFVRSDVCALLDAADRLRITKDASDAAEGGWAPVAVEQIIGPLLDVFSPLAAPEPDASSLLYRAPRSEQEARRWRFQADHGQLLLSARGGELMLGGKLPTLIGGLVETTPAFWGQLAFTLLVWGPLAAIALRASLRRLSFVEAVAHRGAPLEVEDLLRITDSRIVVLHPQPDLAERLRERGIAELRLDDTSAPSAGLAFVAEAERQLRTPEGIAALVSRIEQHAGKLIVLSAIDWTRWAPPEDRVVLDEAFRTFTIVRGPGILHWPEEEAACRALASATWASCSPDERRILAQLVIYGYVAPHPENEPRIAHLRARGLVRHSRLALREAHFRRFVRHTVRAAELRDTARGDERDAWNAIRVPLSTAVLLLLCLLSFMQPELAAIGLPTSSLLTASRPLLRLLDVTVLGD